MGRSPIPTSKELIDRRSDASKEICACNDLPQVCLEGSEEDVATVETRALCGADGVSGIGPIRLLNNLRASSDDIV